VIGRKRRFSCWKFDVMGKGLYIFGIEGQEESGVTFCFRLNCAGRMIDLGGAGEVSSSFPLYFYLIGVRVTPITRDIESVGCQLSRNMLCTVCQKIIQIN